MGKQGSANDYAKHRGVSAVAVSKALKTGRIKPHSFKGSRAILDFDQCDRAWDKNKDPSNRGYEAASRPTSTAPNDDEDVPVEKMTFNQARTKREQYQAELARIEFEEKSGVLISAEKVKAQAFKATRTVRDNMLNIPDRLAPMLVGRTDLHEVRKLLLEEIHKSLEDLAA